VSVAATVVVTLAFGVVVVLPMLAFAIDVDANY